jgi:hypothetical protein
MEKINNFIDQCQLLGVYNDKEVYLYISSKYKSARIFYTPNYYYKILIDNNINYPYDEYKKDLKYALCYIPFFTAIWFGSMPMEEQIDKNWIYFFIQKLFCLLKL